LLPANRQTGKPANRQTGKPAAERDSFGEVVLVGRLHEAIRRLNFSIPERLQRLRTKDVG